MTTGGGGGPGAAVGAVAAGPLRPERTTPVPLADLLALLPGAAVYPPAAAGTADGSGASGFRLTGVTHDSRSVRAGDLYAALPGARVHGAAFSRRAEQAGASAVLTDAEGARRATADGVSVPVVVVVDPRGRLGPVAARVYGDPSRRLRLLGVTGTNGKTTVSYLVEAGLRAAGEVTGLVGTVETRVAGTAVPAVRTTPEATDLQALFATMVERGVGSAVMEVSSHALALGRVEGSRFAAAAFTNLSQDHLDFHPDLESYFAAKASLFAPGRSRLAVVDVDDAWGRRLAESLESPVTCSCAGADGRPARAAHWTATDLDTRPAGSSFRLGAPDGAHRRVEIRLPGAFNVSNAVVALALLASAGVDLDAAVAGVAALPGVPGRMERVEAGQPFLALVDYAHTPEAVTTLLAAVRGLTSGRVLVVLGCGGDRDRGKRPAMGAAAARGADVAVLTSDNPRSEDPASILRAVADGAAGVPAPLRAEVHVEPDRAAAVALAVRAARPGDVVVVAGKGHETGQEQDGRVTPFDDRVVLRAALASLDGRGGGRADARRRPAGQPA